MCVEYSRGLHFDLHATAPAPCNVSDAVEPEENGQAGRAGWRAGTVGG